MSAFGAGCCSSEVIRGYKFKAWEGPETVCNVKRWLWLAWHSHRAGWPRLLAVLLPLTLKSGIRDRCELLCGALLPLLLCCCLKTRAPCVIQCGFRFKHPPPSSKHAHFLLVLPALSQCLWLVMSTARLFGEMSAVESSWNLYYLELCIYFLVFTNGNPQRHKSVRRTRPLF